MTTKLKSFHLYLQQSEQLFSFIENILSKKKTFCKEVIQ